MARVLNCVACKRQQVWNREAAWHIVGQMPVQHVGGD